MPQIWWHRGKKSGKLKMRSTLFYAVSAEIFVRIMTKNSIFEIWNFLKMEYEGDKKMKGMQFLNLISEFELQKMKDSESLKDYNDKLLGITNKVKLLGIEFLDSR